MIGQWLERQLKGREISLFGINYADLLKLEDNFADLSEYEIEACVFFRMRDF